MNPKRLVKISNVIGIIATLFLLYWVFILTVTVLFELNIFKDTLTEAFFMSITGILALMAGTLMINVMLNLTRIADRLNRDRDRESNKHKKRSWVWIGVLASFPIILALLIVSDTQSKRLKEKSMIAAAETIIQYSPNINKQLANYEFTLPWLKETQDNLNTLGKIDRYFPSVSIIVQEEIEGNPVYLEFTRYSSYYAYNKDKPDQPEALYNKTTYLYSTTEAERNYFHALFNDDIQIHRFQGENARYRLFYPYQQDGKTILFRFDEYANYGYGSK